MPVNDVTTNHSYQKPNIANTLSDDVGRLRSALDSIDTDMASKAPSAGPTFTGVTTVAAGSAAGPSLTFTGATSDTGLYSPGADQLALSTASTERARIDSSGRLLVGTSTSETGAVFGSARIQLAGADNNTSALLIVNTLNGAAGRAANIRTGRIRGTGAVVSGDTLGDWSHWGYDGSTYVEGARIRSLVTGTVASGDVPTDLVFYTKPSGSTVIQERLRIDSSGRLLVGTSESVPTYISTAATTPRLQVVGTDTSQAHIGVYSTAATGASSYASLSLSGTGTGAAAEPIGILQFNRWNGTQFRNSARIIAYAASTTTATEWPGYLSFQTTEFATPAEKMRLSHDGYLRLAGKGIQFNGDTADANSLDDYEEGTFTPTIIGTTTAGTGTYTAQVGRYTKVGNSVRFQIFLNWTAHTGTGNMRVSGLPFTSVNATDVQSPAAVAPFNLTFSNDLSAFTVQNTTQVYLRTYATGAAEADLPIATAAAIRIAGVYEAA